MEPDGLVEMSLMRPLKDSTMSLVCGFGAIGIPALSRTVDKCLFAFLKCAIAASFVSSMAFVDQRARRRPE